MKAIIKYIGISLLSVYSINTTQAQATATATSEARILQPIQLTKTADLRFGIIAPGASAGTVHMAVNSTRYITGGVTLPSNTGTYNYASFLVQGEPNFNFSYTYPADIQISNSAGDLMWVRTFDVYPQVANGGGAVLDGTGQCELRVDGILHVGANQAAGYYSSMNGFGATPFSITVNYN